MARSVDEYYGGMTRRYPSGCCQPRQRSAAVWTGHTSTGTDPRSNQTATTVSTVSSPVKSLTFLVYRGRPFTDAIAEIIKSNRRGFGLRP